MCLIATESVSLNGGNALKRAWLESSEVYLDQGVEPRRADDRRVRDALLSGAVCEADAESAERNSSCLPLPGLVSVTSSVCCDRRR